MERRRKASIRKPGHDYSSDGLYFVTSCIQDRWHHFGEVVDGQMQLSDQGRIAEAQWHWLIDRYSYLVGHAFVVMPDHIHAVVEIDRSRLVDGGVHGVGVVGASRDLTLQHQPQSEPDTVHVKIKPLDQLMGAYKTTSSKLIHLAGYPEFQWQRSYHDHIVRSKASLERIKAYIVTNPERWDAEDYFAMWDWDAGK